VQKRIGWTHLQSRMIVPNKVIVLHEHRPASLSSGEILRRLEVCQVPVISDNSDRVLCTSQVLAPLLECVYDSEKLLVIDIVISLSRSESFWKVFE